jgi:hypothetical protein
MHTGPWVGQRGQELIGRQREYDREKEKLRNACESCREDFLELVSGRVTATPMILEDCLRLYEKREGTLVHQITNGIYLCIR